MHHKKTKVIIVGAALRFYSLLSLENWLQIYNLF